MIEALQVIFQCLENMIFCCRDCRDCDTYKNKEDEINYIEQT